MNICYKDYPASITVTSSGRAAKEHPDLIGRYVLQENKAAVLRPVFKKKDGDYYIYYSSKLYFILVISRSQLYLSMQHLLCGLLVTTSWLTVDILRVRREDYRPYQHLAGSMLILT